MWIGLFIRWELELLSSRGSSIALVTNGFKRTITFNHLSTMALVQRFQVCERCNGCEFMLCNILTKLLQPG